MNDVHEAVADLTSAVTEKVRELSNTKHDLMAVANDMRYSLATGHALESKEQRLYSEIFRQWLAEPKDQRLIRQAIGDLSVKDVTIASTPGGGFALPKELSARIDRMATALCPWLDPVLGGVTTVTTSDYHIPLGQSEYGATRRTESGTVTATNVAGLRDRVPSWAEISCYATLSDWARQDIADVTGFVMREFASQLVAQLSADCWSGTGSNQVAGLTATTPSATVDSASPQRNIAALQFLSWAGTTSPQRILLSDLEALLGVLPERYLGDPSCAWIMRPSTWQRVLAAGRSGTSGVIDAAFLMPREPTLFGLPVRFTTGASVLAGGSYPIAVGAWAPGFALVDRGAPSVTVDDATSPGSVKWWYRRRIGGCVVSNTAIKLLKT